MRSMDTRKHQWSFLDFSSFFLSFFSLRHVSTQLVHIATARGEEEEEEKNGPKSGLISE
jgi:hypothetical protein